MRNLEIAKLFNEIADLLEIKDENIFKIRGRSAVASPTSPASARTSRRRSGRRLKQDGSSTWMSCVKRSRGASLS